MKILHIINYFQPVLGYQETYLAKEDIKKGHEVYVLTSDRYAPALYVGDASKQILGDRIQSSGFFIEEGINVIRLKVNFEFLNNVWLHKLKKTVLNLKPDVIIVHGICSITAIRIAKIKNKLDGTEFIFDDHMNFLPRRSNWIFILYKLYKLFFSKIILDSADKLVAVTGETKLFMNKIYGLPFDKIELIPLGCDTDKFYRSDNCRTKFRKELGIKDNQVVFCYVGKIIPAKGVDLLVEASIKLLESGRDIFILCVGAKDLNYFGQITEKIKLTSFKERFIFLPPVSSNELFKYYSVADVGVWPKQCSITMLEAMACSIPVIISNNSNASEAVASEGSGFVYKESDIRDLCQKMIQLLDSDIRECMSMKARQVAESYSWRNISMMFESLYGT
ncbi:glycosyltransferase family 4 protein [Methanosarcina mazei]|uniref:Glycosyltransferase family 1 protein n=2 Tax=Methanosarcina mazei TaxID=2209 RepID=A0A4P8QZB7_METMZ|nr:glycosyltransferase family 4 protein [Methanosarcina mazei]AAM30874.1 glycosyltransferase [Methanosarcina mazei Go1]QCR17028.1 glycosyltransferase family 1 protein [Methanosarcina mazei]WIM44409.1 glycosyltransferase family 4 protein [Methanosarcina mazei]WIM47865.1 glycosyltransferase family 4 protein [Methanosarcina mazei]